VLSRPVTITVDALATMLRIHEVGELSVAIQPDPVWYDAESEDAATDVAWREFAEVGLVGRPGRLDGDALDTLHVLARPRVEYTAIVSRNGRQGSVVVAGLGDEAVVARRSGRAVTLTTQPYRSLPDALMRRIPDRRPAPIEAVNVRIGDRRHGGSSDLRTLAYLGGLRAIGQGELYVAVRDEYGHRRRGGPVRYQDYTVGRVVVVVGGAQLSAVPATKVLLRDRLLALYRQVAGRE
jgi:hypothetical protein